MRPRDGLATARSWRVRLTPQPILPYVDLSRTRIDTCLVVVRWELDCSLFIDGARGESHRRGLYQARCTSRKEGFGPPRVSPLVPVQSRTGTNGGISPGSCAQGPRGPFVPVRLDLLVPVGATNRD